MACSYRPLKIYEILDGVSFYLGNPGCTILDGTTKLPREVIDLCKPLVEEGPYSTIDFVHFSAKEYVFICS
jgi:hypothetical protein